MRLLLLLPTVFLLVACISDPVPGDSDASMADTHIQENITEAVDAQEEYTQLQKERNAQ